MRVPRLVIAGAGSGTGKTTLVAGLLKLLARKGVKVQPFKAGPDYIDPGFHTAACGRDSRNLDPVWFDRDGILELFERTAGDADLALVEGVMGLYDGKDPLSDRGSTAHLARILDAPVILVADAGGMGRSAAAMVHGYATFGRTRPDQPAKAIHGVVFNRVSGARHIEILRSAVEGTTGIPLVGYLPKNGGVNLPERHLGLVPAAESPFARLEEALDRVASLLEDTLDVELLMRIARSAPPLPLFTRRLWCEKPSEVRCRLALAKDSAFHFYYRDGLEYLERQGAELVPFSPLEDTSLPEGVDGVYIGGGYPEVFAARLSANEPMFTALRQAARMGMPLYGECGGLMYLSKGLVDHEGEFYDMAGVIPGECLMEKRPVALGYAEGELPADCILGQRGDRLTGHEFHYSRWDPRLGSADHGGPALTMCGGRRVGQAEGYRSGNVLATYLHLHFAANPGAAAGLVKACRAFRHKRLSGSGGCEHR